MQKEDCFQLGVLTRIVGNDGRLLLELDTDDSSPYKKIESAFVEINNTLIPFFIQSLKLINATQAHLKFEDIDSAEKAAELVGSALFLPIELLPELSGTQFYYHEVIGFEIRNQQGESAGIITDVLENGPNDLFRLNLNGAEVLLPVAGDWIHAVDRQNRVIIMEWPDGILEINRK